MSRDAVVVGSGPNGLAAAVTLARAGLDVEVLEANDHTGGGASTGHLTAPGYLHDLGSAVHPMALASPFFTAFDLTSRIDLVVPEVSYAHPLPGGSALAYRSLERTVDELGADGAAYRRLLGALVERAQDVAQTALSPLVGLPPRPVAAALLGAATALQGSRLWNLGFSGEEAPALLTGCAAHAIGSHPGLPLAGAGLVLATLAHAGGWPLPIRGSQSITDALVADLEAHGGRVRTGVRVQDVRELGSPQVTVLNLSSQQAADVAGEVLPQRYRDRLATVRPGQGICKLDVALSGPIPWRDPDLALAPTLHFGGTRAQIAASESGVVAGELRDHPYVLVVQPSVVDATRAPGDGAVLWAYTHVPYDCPVDRSEVMLDTIEEYAPGLRDLIVAQHSITANHVADEISANFAGGDFASGALDLRQLIARPVASPTPWKTPVPGLYLASGATAPGPAVHGMAGWSAAKLALRELGLPEPDLAP